MKHIISFVLFLFASITAVAAPITYDFTVRNVKIWDFQTGGLFQSGADLTGSVTFDLVMATSHYASNGLVKDYSTIGCPNYFPNGTCNGTQRQGTPFITSFQISSPFGNIALPSSPMNGQMLGQDIGGDSTYQLLYAGYQRNVAGTTPSSAQFHRTEMVLNLEAGNSPLTAWGSGTNLEAATWAKFSFMDYSMIGSTYTGGSLFDFGARRIEGDIASLARRGAAVPEPGSTPLILVGLALVAYSRYRFAR